MCVCVCVPGRMKEGMRDMYRWCVCVRACVCVCVPGRMREGMRDVYRLPGPNNTKEAV